MNSLLYSGLVTKYNQINQNFDTTATVQLYYKSNKEADWRS